jgi:hypothetical protein
VRDGSRISPKKWPVDFAGGEYVMNNDPYSREEGESEFIEVGGTADLEDLR